MIVQLLASFTGSLGFCLVFHLRRRYLLPASLGGLLTCAVYMAAASGMDGILLPTLTASAFAALYAEVLAWLLHAPTTLFLTTALVIPLIPGRTVSVWHREKSPAPAVRSVPTEKRNRRMASTLLAVNTQKRMDD